MLEGSKLSRFELPNFLPIPLPQNVQQMQVSSLLRHQFHHRPTRMPVPIRLPTQRPLPLHGHQRVSREFPHLPPQPAMQQPDRQLRMHRRDPHHATSNHQTLKTHSSTHQTPSQRLRRPHLQERQPVSS